MIKINKNKANRLFNEGKTIYIVPCKVKFDFSNPWIKPFELKKTDEHVDFIKLVNGFSYYNCNTELGKYLHFYID